MKSEYLIERSSKLLLINSNSNVNEPPFKNSSSSHSRTQSLLTNNINNIDEIKYKQLINENEKLREERRNHEKQKVFILNI
jgi:hypothetical protein